MSLPNRLLDEDEKVCVVCMDLFAGSGRLCDDCRYGNADLYSDAAIQDALDAKEGR